MSDEEIADALDKFSDYLDLGNIFIDPFRLLGWIIIKGLQLILDGLESVTNDILFLKKFFQNSEIVDFIDSIQPFLYILLAFSILYAGYMLIFQKKFNREGMAINLFIALMVIALLGTGMEKANEFTDDAIKAIGSQQLYSEEEGSISQNIISRNIIDLTEFDAEGNEWETTEIEKNNTIPLKMVDKVTITEKFDSSRKELKMSKNGKEISKKQMIWVYGERDLSKLDQSGLEWNNSYYYRYHLNWISLITTLIVMSFTLLSISYKLARLSFELVFNYILAIIVAPADIHDGQKTKKILQSIMNTFLVIILIFLSMKVYMIGTGWIADELSGMAYLIALIAFSVAVIDGPNIVERLFGIDAGLKSGWGMVMGGYGAYKMASGVGKSMKDKVSSGGKKDGDKTGGNGNKPSNENKPPSPNDPPNSDPSSTSGVKDGKGDDKNKGKKEDEGNEDKKDGNNDTKGTSKKESVAKASENQKDGKGSKVKNTAPSPNDTSPTGSASPTRNGNNVTGGASPTGSENETGSENTTTSGGKRTGVNNSKPTAPKPTSAGDIGKGSNQTNKNKAQQKSTIRTDTDIDHVVEEVAGTQNVNTKNVGGGSRKSEVKPTSSGSSSNSSGGGSHESQKSTVQQRSTVRQDVDVNHQVDHVQGTTNTTERVSRTENRQERKRPKQYNMGGKKKTIKRDKK